jgi:hypothetical protein
MSSCSDISAVASSPCLPGTNTTMGFDDDSTAALNLQSIDFLRELLAMIIPTSSLFSSSPSFLAPSSPDKAYDSLIPDRRKPSVRGSSPITIVLSVLCPANFARLFFGFMATPSVFPLYAKTRDALIIGSGTSFSFPLIIFVRFSTSSSFSIT